MNTLTLIGCSESISNHHVCQGINCRRQMPTIPMYAHCTPNVSRGDCGWPAATNRTSLPTWVRPGRHLAPFHLQAELV